MFIIIHETSNTSQPQPSPPLSPYPPSFPPFSHIPRYPPFLLSPFPPFPPYPPFPLSPFPTISPFPPFTLSPFPTISPFPHHSTWANHPIIARIVFIVIPWLYRFYWKHLCCVMLCNPWSIMIELYIFYLYFNLLN